MRTLINDGWCFAELPAGSEYPEAMDQAEFKPVDLPHDWMIRDTENLYRSSVGIYTRTLNLDAGKHNSVFFEGVYMRTTVYLNGEKLFFWPYGYTSFEVDLTPLQKDGENQLVVHVDYRCPNTRWYSGAGIFRDVWLLEKDPIHLTEGGISFHAEPEGEDWRVTVDAEAVLWGHALREPEVVIRHTLWNNEGEEVASGEVLTRLYGEPSLTTMSFPVKEVRPWDIEDPYLYFLETRVEYRGEVKDLVLQRVGFRTITFTPDQGFFLNGRHVKICGACMHHDLGALGAAFNRKAAKRQLEKLRTLGVNAIRTSHNPPAVGLMELADEMGILVNSDAFDMWEMPKTENDYGVFFHEWVERDVESWIRRDRNHPSVIMWSCGNEIPDTNSLSAVEIAKRLRAAIRRNDPRHNAYSTIASNYVAWENAQKVQEIFELSGYNYLESVYDEHHQKFPHWVIYGSETASTVQSRGIYHFPKSSRLLTYEDRQCSSLDNCSTNWGAKSVHRFITDDRDRPFSAGQFIWTGWDYIGEPTPYFSKNSFFGHIDTAGFYKDTAYILKAGWVDPEDHPFVHISPYWDFNEGQMIDVEVYSNAARVVLFFNGEKVGEKELDRLKDKDFSAHFRLPYREGVLRAEAYTRDGRLCAEDETGSFGDANKIWLTPEYPYVLADGEDLQFIQVTVLDEQGNEVRNARNRVKVSVEGPARLVGMDNGDSTDYEPYKTNTRKLFSGKLILILASVKEPGEVRVRVTSPGLQDAEVIYESVKAVGREGVSCMEDVQKSELPDPGDLLKEIPVRKITLTGAEKLPSGGVLTPECPEVQLFARISPEDATWKDVQFKAVTPEGIESRAAELVVEGQNVRIRAVSDGAFRLSASAGNGKDHPEILSELEFRSEGFGSGTLDPYSGVHGCEYAESKKEALLSFRGGVNFGDENVIRFDQVDFGSFGSDRLFLSLFSFRNEEEVEIWDGEPDHSECLFSGMYRVPSEYNVLQEDSFLLTKRLSGVRSITFRFAHGFVLGGFRMERQEKAYARICATERNMITGDSYEEKEDGIYAIGNNVDLEFTGMRFTEGVSSVTITGRARKTDNPIHIRFFHGDEVEKRVVEFPVSGELITRTFPISGFSGEGKVNLIFLPGSDFDLIDFRFAPENNG